MKMKKFFLILLALMTLLGTVGCTSKTEDQGNPETDPSSNSSQKEDSTNPSETFQTGKKVLVVYYSATGTTEKIAKSIAAYTNADIFVITPEQEYTSEDLNWRNEDSRVSVEHDHPDSRDVKLVTTTPENFKDYDTVLIGYPIWWGIAAWPVDTFVKENDFSGKTVIPFCTAASSDIGESGDLLAEMAKTGDWKQGRRFYSNSSESEVQSWLESFAD